MYHDMKKIRSIKGLTLVEILVVLGLFSGISTLALGALFNTQTINNKLLQNQAILDNVNLSLQTVTRDIRYGMDFHCSDTLTPATTTRRSCLEGDGGGTVLIFKSQDGVEDEDRDTYFVHQGILYKRETRTVSSLPVDTTYQMTSSDIYITKFVLYVDGAYASNPTLSFDTVSIDYSQPKITLFISGRVGVIKPNETPSTFNIETTISPRVIDNS